MPARLDPGEMRAYTRAMGEPGLDALRRSEERLHAVIESSPLAIVEVDPRTRIIAWNPAAERIFGWTQDEMLGRPDVPMVPDFKRGEHEDLVARLGGGQILSDFETVRRRKDGTLIDVAVAAAPVRDASGRVVGQMVIYSDISERRLQEARLAEAQGSRTSAAGSGTCPRTGSSGRTRCIACGGASLDRGLTPAPAPGDRPSS